MVIKEWGAYQNRKNNLFNKLPTIQRDLISEAFLKRNTADHIFNHPELMTTSDFEQGVKFYAESLSAAKSVEINELNKLNESLGNHFKNDFVAGLELVNTRIASSAVAGNSRLKTGIRGKEELKVWPQ